jgi:hypothetical protein
MTVDAYPTASISQGSTVNICLQQRPQL